VYQQIFSDFAEGVTALPTRSTQIAAEFNRATQGAAQGFLAKAKFDLCQLFGFKSKILRISCLLW